MTLDAWLYGNPETVAIRKQEMEDRKHKACGTCVHHKTIEFQGETHHACEYKRRIYGRRCDLFEDQPLERK